MYGIDLLPQLGILQTLQDAPFLRFVQRGRERLVLLFQLFIFSGGLGEGYVVLSQLVLHPCHVGDIQEKWISLGKEMEFIQDLDTL